MHEVLALIPARGGSKAIPRKNLIAVGGLPLIAHSIRHALASRLINRVIVSTEDAEIADVAVRYGAEVPFVRPDAFAQDASTDLEVFQHALEWLRGHEGYEPEAIVHLRPTGPVRRVALIDEAIDRLLADPAADSIRSVSVALQTPYKMWRIESGRLHPVIADPALPESHSMPRQQLPRVYWQNGYVDVIRPRAIHAYASMCGRTVLPFVVNEPIYEIDYMENLPAVEKALREVTGPANVPAGGERHSV